MGRKTNINDLLEMIDFEYWLDSEGVEYKPTFGTSGEQANIKTCPMCGDDRWKVYANLHSGLGKCHVCDRGINKWKFISLTLGISGRDTVDYIKSVASQLGWRPPVQQEIKRVNMAPGEILLPESMPIPMHGMNHPYLEERGIGADDAEYFHLRYAKRGWFVYKINGVEKYQLWEERIVIPVFNLDGEMIAFQGRDITGTAAKKYLFPPAVKSTGSVLFNGHNAKGAKTVIVCEGVFDVFATRSALASADIFDIPVIATFGKHLSNANGADQVGEFLKLGAEGLEEIVFMWDGTPDATSAALDAGMTLRRLGFRVKIAELPKDKDPNEVPKSVVVSAFKNAVTMGSGAWVAQMLIKNGRRERS